MIRITSQNVASAPFASFQEAQNAHLELVRRVDAAEHASEDTHDAPPDTDVVALARLRDEAVALARLRRDVRLLEWRLAATGTRLSNPGQRNVTQSLLDYWSLRQSDLRGRITRVRAATGIRRPILSRSPSPRVLMPLNPHLATTLARTAEETYARLPDETARAEAARLFLAIVTGRALGADGMATRDAFVASGVLAPSESGPVLAHDELPKSWPRLADWLAADIAHEREFARVRANAESWARAPGDATLPTGEALKKAAKFVTRDQTIACYVDAARVAIEEQEVRRRRSSWFTIIAVAIVLLSILTLGIVAATREPAAQSPPTAAKAPAVDDKTARADASVASSVGGEEIVRETPPPTSVDTNAPGVTDWIWIGSDSRPQVHDITGGRIVPSKLRKDALVTPGAKLRLREDLPGPNNKAALQSGIVPPGIVAVAISAPTPVSVRGTIQYWLNVRLVPTVYIQVPRGAGEFGTRLRNGLAEKGFSTPGVEETPVAEGMSEIRYYHKQDAGVADALRRELANNFGDSTGGRSVAVRSFVASSLRARVAQGTIELWIGPPA